MTQTVSRGPMDPVRFWGVDRFLVPFRAPQTVSYFLDRLFVSHGRRERLSRATLARFSSPRSPNLFFGWREWRLTPGKGRLDPGNRSAHSCDGDGWGQALGLIEEFQDHPDLLAGTDLSRFPLDRSIFLQDYNEAPRGRVIAFPFPKTGASPAAVVKLRSPAGGGRSLRAEWDALHWVRGSLNDPSLAATVPEALAFRETPTLEVLVLSHLEGRSAYWDQRNRINPGRRMGSHLTAAAHWLARFHRALGIDVSMESRICHGDFWARNLLLAPERGHGKGAASVVVDWEHFDKTGLAHHDLFHFPVTYARSHPGRRYRQSPLPEAFKNAFLDRTPLGGAMQTYFARYSAGTGVAPRVMEPLFHDYLRTQSRCSEGREREDWLECLALLEASQTVLSRCDPSSC